MIAHNRAWPVLGRWLGTTLLLATVVALLAIYLARSTIEITPEPPVGEGRASSAESSPRCPRGSNGVKPPLVGIVTVDELPEQVDESYIGGVSVNVRWTELQPTPGRLIRPNAIDAAIEALRRRPGGPCPRGVKIRVLAGVHAPQWAKELDGSPVKSTLAEEGRAGTVPRFWTRSFGRAYEALQQELAAVYDEEDLVREVVISRCTTFYAEPFLRQVGGGADIRTFADAGLDAVSDRTCLLEQIDAHDAWRRTPSSLALNPYIDVEGTVGSLALPVEVADLCREKLDERCVLANNSIRWPPLGRKYPELYEYMTALGPPIEFQAASPRRIGDVSSTVRWASARGASSVELEPLLLQSLSGPLPVPPSWRHYAD